MRCQILDRSKVRCSELEIPFNRIRSDMPPNGYTAIPNNSFFAHRNKDFQGNRL